MAEINSVFAVPMIFHKLEDCSALHAELEALFVARAAEGRKYSNPSPLLDRNELLFESNFRLFDWPHDCVRHDSDDLQSMSGRLTFINPHLPAAMYMDMALMNMRPPYGMGPLNLRLEPGELVIFPSWLLHQVLPYEGDTLRITAPRWLESADAQGYEPTRGRSAPAPVRRHRWFQPACRDAG